MKRHRTAGGVQTFSFLDAMVCTMGALLVLVHAFARHGEVQAIKSPELKAARENCAAMLAEAETLQWRTGQLQEMRDKTQAQLAEERRKLSHVEDHERRLLAELEELRIAATELERSVAANGERNGHAAAELDAAQARVRQAKDALDRARRTARQAAVNYSVVPYQGPNTTNRRPIYIECRRDAIVLQPEGIELGPADFCGFLGPGNPLASAVRGISEYWARQAPAGKVPDPYPLLLVRPEGVQAYYDARLALASWSNDFGYELIGSDWELAFPEPDAQLAQLTRQIVADAALRMQALVASLEQMQRHRPRTALHASPGGGFVEQRSHSGGHGRGSSGGAGDWAAAGSGWARGESGDDEGYGGSGGSSIEPGDRYARGLGDGDAHPYGGSPSAGGSLDGSGRGDGLYPRGDEQATGASQYGSTAGSAGSQTARGGSTADPQRGPYGQNLDAESSSAGDGAYDHLLADAARGSRAGQPGGKPGGASGQAGNGGASATASSGSSDACGDPSQSAPAGMPHPSFGGQKSAKSMAQARGRDWGLPDASSRSSPATRPILVECYPDRLVIPSEDRGRPPAVVRLGADAQDSMDEFVSHVWDHMKTWGTAGKGLYWRPTLLMDIKPGADGRFTEVRTLLSDSGLDVGQRKQQAAAPSATRGSMH